MSHTYTINTPCNSNGRSYFMIYEVLYVEMPHKIAENVIEYNINYYKFAYFDVLKINRHILLL